MRVCGGRRAPPPPPAVRASFNTVRQFTIGAYTVRPGREQPEPMEICRSAAAAPGR
jgi:hypothetical protein